MNNIRQKIEEFQKVGKIFESIEKLHISPFPYDIYEVDINFLKLNPFNGRIRAQIHDAGLIKNISLYDNSKILEDKKQKFLQSEKQQKFKKLQISIKNEGQHSPLIILQNGIVVDGNSRLTAIRNLNIQTAKIIILQKDYHNVKDLEILETTIQFKKIPRESYTNLNKEIKITNMFNQYTKGISKQKRIEEISKIFGVPKGMVKASIDKIQFLDNTFKIFNVQFKYKWFEDTTELIKNVISFINKTFKNLNLTFNPWYKDNEKLFLQFLEALIILILAKPRIISGTRELFSIKKNINLATNKEILYNFVNFYLNEIKLKNIINAYVLNKKNELEKYKNMANKQNDYLINKMNILLKEKLQKSQNIGNIWNKQIENNSKGISNNFDEPLALANSIMIFTKKILRMKINNDVKNKLNEAKKILDQI